MSCSRRSAEDPVGESCASGHKTVSPLSRESPADRKSEQGPGAGGPARGDTRHEAVPSFERGDRLLHDSIVGTEAPVVGAGLFEIQLLRLRRYSSTGFESDVEAWNTARFTAP